MLRTLDRYLIREIALPLGLALVILTFVLEIPTIMTQAEQLVASGLEWSIVLQVLVALLPAALCLTIPMAVLLGILVGCGRLAADREFVAMQACGVSVTRLARPVLLVAAIGTAATAYETIVALPDANQKYREIVFVELATRVESTVRPRVFFQQFPDKIVYVRELPPEGGWRDVFLADTSRPGETTVYFAREGRIRLDTKNRLVQIELVDGTSHTTQVSKPDDHQVSAFQSSYITLDPQTVFKEAPPRGAREKTTPELRREIAEAEARNAPAYEARFMIQNKLALPATCPILALIGLALGTSSRKDGRLGSFVVGIMVIFVYYILLFGARAAAMGGRMNPDWAPWIPNIVMGIGAVVLVIWRMRGGESIRFRLPPRMALPWRRRSSSETTSTPASGRIVALHMPGLPMLRLLDVYVLRSYLGVFLLGIVGLLGVFYISTFIDLVDKLLRGETTGTMLMRYFYFRTPQFIYFVIPMSVLVSTLVTVGVFTKNSELMVMRACGVSLYRAAAPLLVVGVLLTGLVAFLQERVLVTTNREADQLERTIRRWGPATTVLNRRWVVGTNGDMYHYDFFQEETNSFRSLMIYRLDQQAWRLRAVTRAEEASFVPKPKGSDEGTWVGKRGWTRDLSTAPIAGEERPAVKYEAFAERDLALDRPAYFKTEEPIADMMSYPELRDYTARLQASGANAVPQRVALYRKVAFPWVTVIMTILAVPFAVTTGRHGALYGIGIGIGLAILYIVTMSLSGALGSGGVLPPLLAAWAPNLLFGATALYLVFTVRT
jgi:LPS export ABC transporter permease LptG/LPS export ABC transporter permease LptF